ncbi:MAG: TonB-dependent receptor [Gammaproteobacteria bacterium]
MNKSHARRPCGRTLSILALLTAGALPLHAAERDLVEMSLAELMDEPVTSVSKKETRLVDSAMAITVITPDDLRRLGITSIPEALRLVPGFDVARIDAHHWAVSARGFNQQYANLLLVLVDGRSVYTPTFGGVFWDMQDLMVADLERIEVIRGPGAALWGTNAVNGVVNIITKRASDTQGTVVSANVGTEDQPSLEARYGGTAGQDLSYRVFAKYFDRDGFRESDGSGAIDAWNGARLGFRADWQLSEDRLATLQGDYYNMDGHQLVSSPLLVPPFSTSDVRKTQSDALNVVSRFTQSFSDTSQLSVQAYFDSYTLESESRDTADLQLEHRFAVGNRHDMQWGVGYRYTSDNLDLGDAAIVTPQKGVFNLYTAFLQDDISLIPKRVRLTLGTKLERDDYTGFEIQPNARLLWTPTKQLTLWGSASRAVSAPPRFYRDGRLNISAFQPAGGPVVEVAFLPNANLPAQSLRAFELGMRAEPAESLSVELATFYNLYDGTYLPVAEAPTFETTPVPHVLIPWRWQPVVDYTSYGSELVLNYRPIELWRLTGAYSWLHLRGEPSGAFDHASPAHQVSIRSYSSLTTHVELNASLAWVSAIESVLQDATTMSIPSHVRLDLGVVAHPTAAVEVGVWGQNLMDRRHAEINDLESPGVTEIPRSVLLRVTGRF